MNVQAIARRKTLRCAIYTRKSTEEGLDQEFNSLDAQREACEAYIASQRHEGWKLVPDRYDDGGISGGTLERPGVRRLLDDVKAGKVDLVVVYKIDRLTRSLADFAKLVDEFDAANCSFVSVTQAFNTATSMGRLTLNVLLSFAQFEREVTAERIRDKIAASKKKGLWMGGACPLGYEPDGRTLKIIEAEAETVRTIFRLYAELGCLRKVQLEAERLGLKTKKRESRNPKLCGGVTPSRGRIHQILRNPIYAGKIRHKEKVYDGQHPAIVDAGLFEAVQEKIAFASDRPTNMKDPASRSLLVSRLWDGEGNRMIPSHTKRKKKRYRYYVSAPLIEKSGEQGIEGSRLPAVALEKAVGNALADHLTTGFRHGLVASMAGAADVHRLSNTLRALAESKLEERLQLIRSVTVKPGEISLSLCAERLGEALQIEPDLLADEMLVCRAPYTLRRRGVETKLILGQRKPEPDARMQRTLARAIQWLDELRNGTSLDKLAEREKLSPRFLRSRLQMAFLSPAIMKAIVDGTQPVHLSTHSFTSSEIPMDWDEQARLFGFGSD